VDEVEKRLNDAHAENSALQQRLNALEMENKSLKLQLSKIGNVFKQAPELMEKFKKSTVIESTSSSTSGKFTSSKKAKTAFSATLFVILFSFGLFVNFGGRSLDPLSSCSGSLKQFSPVFHTGKTLKSAGDFVVVDQPTVWDLYAPAFLHNFVSSVWPREVLEEDPSDFLSKPAPMYTDTLGSESQNPLPSFFKSIHEATQPKNETAEQNVLITSSRYEL